MLRRYVRDEDSAEDIHQATFEVIIRRLRESGIDDPARIKQFIRQTAVNLAKGEFRKRDRQQTFTDSELIASTPDRGRSLYDRIERDQLLAAVRRAAREAPHRPGAQQLVGSNLDRRRDPGGRAAGVHPERQGPLLRAQTPLDKGADLAVSALFRSAVTPMKLLKKFPVDRGLARL